MSGISVDIWQNPFFFKKKFKKLEFQKLFKIWLIHNYIYDV